MEFKLTKNQKYIADLVESCNSNILVHGKPGVGKSVLIRWLVENGRKTYTLAAPTGLAALNIGGKTLHSLFGIPVSQGIIHPTYNVFSANERVCNNIKYRVKHLIIDEISMVRADVLDYIDRFMRSVKGYDASFGGVQVIAVGDFYQIPPVVVDNEHKQLDEAGYDSPFAFSSNAFKEGNFIIESLDEVLRQKGDKKFINILHAARTGDVKLDDIARLNKCVKVPKDLRIKLTGTNKQADIINSTELSKLESKPYKFTATKFGEWPALPVEENLVLKIGAQVIVKMNGADRPNKIQGEFESSVVNGTMGTVVEIYEEDSVEETVEKVIIQLESGEQVPIYRKRWEHKIKEKVDDEWKERIVASYSQIPLSLAWAISIHKSQGQSFDKVHIDANKIFAAGQLYVALSRCRSLKGLTLESELAKTKFWANRNVIQFFNELEEQKVTI